MRNRSIIFITALLALMAFSSRALAQTGRQTVKSQPGDSSKLDPHDLSGVWFPSQGGTRAVDTNVRPPMTPWAEALYKVHIPHAGPRFVRGGENDPVLKCYPDGMPKTYVTPQPFEIFQLPEYKRVLINYEFHMLRRQIWTDGRPLPKDPEPAYMGYSVGHWEGDEFVINSIGFNDITWLDFDGSPHSEDMKVTERFKRVDRKTLSLAVTIEDPKAYTKPWVSKPSMFELKPDWELLEHYCIEEEEQQYEKSIMYPSDGKSEPNGVVK
jgi:hypothetical protein